MTRTETERWTHLAMYSSDDNAKEILRSWREWNHDQSNPPRRRLRFAGRGPARCAVFESALAGGEWREEARIYRREADKTMMVTSFGRMLVVTIADLKANW